mmetsp:Transcript_54729/g.131190  ORF Transcript_54729/g.131190 Transcript_54729/m.131190 type:complete len:225 (+) Transcript_54729:97-771(+)
MPSTRREGIEVCTICLEGLTLPDTSRKNRNALDPANSSDYRLAMLKACGHCFHSHCLINHIRHWCRHGSHTALCCPLCRSYAHTEGTGSGRRAIMWLPKARQTKRSREEEVAAARQTLMMFEQMFEMAGGIGDGRMLEIARELIADQRKSLHSLIAEQRQAMVRAHIRRGPPSDATPPLPTLIDELFSSIDELAASGGPALLALGNPRRSTRRSSRASGRPRPY